MPLVSSLGGDAGRGPGSERRTVVENHVHIHDDRADDPSEKIIELKQNFLVVTNRQGQQHPIEISYDMDTHLIHVGCSAISAEAWEILEGRVHYLLREADKVRG